MLILYLLIGFVIFFFMYKKFWHYVEGRGKYDSWVEVPQFWMIITVSTLWPLCLPGYVIWQVLEKIYTNLNKNKEEDEESIN